jgi:hypothetical protein
MPYIKMEDRPKYEKPLGDLIATLKSQPVESIDGELNYIITRILKEAYPLRYFNLNRAVGVLECCKEAYPLRYFNLNRAVGVLECCKLEFYRRVAAPYEDTKIQQNGDV